MAEDLIQLNDHLYEIPQQGRMRVPARIYASSKMIPDILKDHAAEQAAQVAWLPGILSYSLAMPDIHWGYGFPIGGVAAFDVDEGVISPGGVGYDINCGVRLLVTDLTRKEITPRLPQLLDQFYRLIPSGVGSTGVIKLSRQQEKSVLEKGALWAVENGYGNSEDLDKIEENGAMAGANPEAVSERALERGRQQLGTLGSGNHFVEIGVVQQVYDEAAAALLGLDKDRVTVTIHTGSRGLGHQVCDDAIKIMLPASRKYGIELPDRQLCCAPIRSEEGQRYLAAMAAAVNFAFANRQMITHWARQALQKGMAVSGAGHAMRVVYEVAHNIAKMERHEVNGVEKLVCVHRKGATRAFGPHHPDVPHAYRSIGQPVLIPGDMGRCSYVLLGTQRAMAETFGSSCHGAGRVMSRTQAARVAKDRALDRELADQGILVRAAGRETLAEEMPAAYKDVTEVVETVAAAGLAVKVVKLKPLAVIKG